MLFDLSRYDFPFPRYHRAKKGIIFNRLISPSLSLTPRLTDLCQTPNKRQERFLEEHGTRFLEKYIGQRVTDLFIINTLSQAQWTLGALISRQWIEISRWIKKWLPWYVRVSWMLFDDKIFNFSSRFLYECSRFRTNGYGQHRHDLCFT